MNTITARITVWEDLKNSFFHNFLKKIQFSMKVYSPEHDAMKKSDDKSF